MIRFPAAIYRRNVLIRKTLNENIYTHTHTASIHTYIVRIHIYTSSIRKFENLNKMRKNFIVCDHITVGFCLNSHKISLNNPLLHEKLHHPLLFWLIDLGTLLKEVKTNRQINTTITTTKATFWFSSIEEVEK